MANVQSLRGMPSMIAVRLWKAGIRSILLLASVLASAGCEGIGAAATPTEEYGIPPAAGMFLPSTTVTSLQTATQTEDRGFLPPPGMSLPSDTTARTQTATALPSPTPTRMGTPFPTPWPAGFTPTVPPTPTRGLPPTMTRGAAETCPEPTHASVVLEPLDDPAEQEQPLLAFLSANGTLHGFEEALGLREEQPFRDAAVVVLEEDVTGDGKPEFLISINQYYAQANVPDDLGVPYRTAIFVFGCRGGEFVTVHRVVLDTNEGLTPYRSQLDAVADLNADGVADVVYSYVRNIGMQFTNLSAQVLEWDGKDFRELLLYESFPGSEWLRSTVDAHVGWQDTDGNGTQEVLFPEMKFKNPEGMGMFMGCDGGVSRNTTSIWMWDGEYYRYMWTEPAPPLYRFQAALDGDLMASLGLYDRAEEMYLRAVFDSSLKPGSRGDWMRDYHCESIHEETPDSAEPERMKAYARFRLVELYVRAGRVNEAEWHRSYMRTNHPVGTPGYFYAYLANAFWWGYADGEDISAACARVVEEAQAHEEDVFGPFEQYGFDNPGPTPTDICPFASSPDG
jgi:hypothetical protein